MGIKDQWYEKMFGCKYISSRSLFTKFTWNMFTATEIVVYILDDIEKEVKYIFLTELNRAGVNVGLREEIM